MTYLAKHITVSIDRPAEQVYDFLAKPENFPQWAAGLASSFHKDKDEWIADSPMGRVKVAFTEKNRFGIIDHDVTLADGKTVHNPMRVLPNDSGSEVVFTLFHRPEMSEKEFSEDAKAVTRDLMKLKEILES